MDSIDWDCVNCVMASSEILDWLAVRLSNSGIFPSRLAAVTLTSDLLSSTDFK